MKIKEIETSHFIIRGFQKEDALWAYSIWNNPEMGQYLPDEAKEEIDEDYLKMLEGLGDDEECCYLIPVFKDSFQRVGTCSFMVSEDQKTYDIAYCVHKKYWGKGYATEIAQGLIDYAKSQNAKKVTIFVNQDNIASNRVAQKCGGIVVEEKNFKKRGTDQIMKEYKYEIDLSSNQNKIGEIIRIHGTSSQVIFDCANCKIKGDGEFRAKMGEIDGFLLDSSSLAFEDGTLLTSQQCLQLKQLYNEYIESHYDSIDWNI